MTFKNRSTQLRQGFNLALGEGVTEKLKFTRSIILKKNKSIRLSSLIGLGVAALLASACAPQAVEFKLADAAATMGQNPVLNTTQATALSGTGGKLNERLNKGFVSSILASQGPSESEAKISATAATDAKPPRPTKSLSQSDSYAKIRAMYDARTSRTVTDLIQLEKKRKALGSKATHQQISAQAGSSMYTATELRRAQTATAYQYGSTDEWYKIEVQVGRPRVSIFLDFSDLDADLDLYLYNSVGSLIESSTDTGDGEFIDRDLGEGTYYVKIRRYGTGAYSARYSIYWDAEQRSPYLDDDSYERNDSRFSAFDLTAHPGRWLSNILGSGIQADDDYYKVTIGGVEQQKLRIYLNFENDDGDIDLRLENSSGVVLSRSNQSSRDDEYIEYTVNPGTYYIVAYYGNNGNEYDMMYTKEVVYNPLFDPAVFVASTYARLNPDLGLHGVISELQLRAHWLANGIREGRTASDTFSSKVYLAKYADLRAAFGPTNYDAAIKHYMSYGKREGRTALPSGPAVNPLLDSKVFNWTTYLDLNADLRAHGVTTEVAAVQHWLAYGVREGRKAHAGFHSVRYLANYADLRAAFGAAGFQAAIQHFVKYGSAEGRSGL